MKVEHVLIVALDAAGPLDVATPKCSSSHLR
jgi:hypothetical protein